MVVSTQAPPPAVRKLQNQAREIPAAILAEPQEFVEQAPAATEAAPEPLFRGDRYGLLILLSCGGLLVILNLLDAFYHLFRGWGL
jgi:hypothetical protein